MTTNKPASAILLTALLLAACSSSDNVGALAGCSESLTGAVQGSYTCVNATSAWDTRFNQGVVSIAASDTSQVSVSIPFIGAPRVGTYTPTTQDSIVGGVSFLRGAYFAGVTALGSTSLATRGDYTLTLTSVTTLSTVTDGTTYTVHGSLDATLPPSDINPGYNTPVMVHITF